MTIVRKGRAVYPGSFDPPTNGHVDLIRRACSLFGELIVAVITNPAKTPSFTAAERVRMLRAVVAEHRLGGCVRVDTFDGLLVDYLKKSRARVVIRGLRAVSDFEYEFQMALTNRRLYPGMELIYLMPDEKWTYLSSSLVKTIARHRGDLDHFVPRTIVAPVRAKLEVHR